MTFYSLGKTKGDLLPIIASGKAMKSGPLELFFSLKDQVLHQANSVMGGNLGFPGHGTYSHFLFQ